MSSAQPLSSSNRAETELARLKESQQLEKSENISYMKTQAIAILFFALLLTVCGSLGFAKVIPLENPLSAVFFFGGLTIASVTMWTARRIQRTLNQI